MTRLLLLTFCALLPLASLNAETLSLDSCRARALRNNKQLSMAKVKKDIAENTRKSVRTKYLPHIDVTGGYMYSSRSISLLNEEQQAMLPHMGTIGSQGMMNLIGTAFTPAERAAGKQIVTNLLTKMTMQGLINPAEAQALQAMGQRLGGLVGVGEALMKEINATGQSIVDAFNTNTHHMFMASAMLTQPIYMGGKITAGYKMYQLKKEALLASHSLTESEVIVQTDDAYAKLVKASELEKVAKQYNELLLELQRNVQSAVKHGMATQNDLLKVKVKLNESELQMRKAQNGIRLATMNLCHYIGKPLTSEIKVVSEYPTVNYQPNNTQDISARPEYQMLSKT